MSYSTGYGEPVPAMISPAMSWSPIDQLMAMYGTISLAVEAVTTAYYMPIRVPTGCVVRRLWWANGATAAGNVSLGIYASTANGSPGAKVIECGATAQGTILQVQFVDVTDTVIPPGLYWIAICASDAAATFMVSRPGLVRIDAALTYKEAGVTVGTLPATATPAMASTDSFYLCGFATTASP
jgi:hypothetical protein